MPGLAAIVSCWNASWDSGPANVLGPRKPNSIERIVASGVGSSHRAKGCERAFIPIDRDEAHTTLDGCSMIHRERKQRIRTRRRSACTCARESESVVR
jgi:hypothetical protein